MLILVQSCQLISINTGLYNILVSSDQYKEVSQRKEVWRINTVVSVTYSGKGKCISLSLPVICSLTLPFYDWYCALCCKQSPLNSIEALQDNSRTYTNCLFLVMFLWPGLLLLSKARPSAGKNQLSKFVSVRMYPVINVVL